MEGWEGGRVGGWEGERARVRVAAACCLAIEEATEAADRAAGATANRRLSDRTDCFPRWGSNPGTGEREERGERKKRGERERGEERRPLAGPGSGPLAQVPLTSAFPASMSTPAAL